MRRLYPFCALALLSACSPNSAQPDANSSAALKPVQMNEARFRDDIKNLSSDEFEGRAPTTQVKNSPWIIYPRPLQRWDLKVLTKVAFYNQCLW